MRDPFDDEELAARVGAIFDKAKGHGMKVIAQGDPVEYDVAHPADACRLYREDMSKALIGVVTSRTDYERARQLIQEAGKSVGRFELRQDEETGRLYWWGSEDGWKDETEVGEDGVLTLSAEHFKVGTILRFSEPFR